MKTYLLVFIALIGMVSFQSCDNLFKNKKMNTGTMNNNAGPDGNNGGEMPDITFEETDHDFGSMKQGEILTYSYKFTNTGKADLIINNCTASCGCTIPQWPRQPIRPGESSFIDVQFDSKGKSNMVVKEVHVATNCNPAVRTIKFHVNVIVPAAQ